MSTISVGIFKKNFWLHKRDFIKIYFTKKKNTLKIFNYKFVQKSGIQK